MDESAYLLNDMQRTIDELRAERDELRRQIEWKLETDMYCMKCGKRKIDCKPKPMHQIQPYEDDGEIS